MLNRLLRQLVAIPFKAVNRYEFRRPKHTELNERSIEYAFLFRHLAQLRPTSCLDVGTGTTALPHLISNCGVRVSAIDNISDYWDLGMFNRHYHVMDDDITNPAITAKFELITCISVLEHITDHAAAMRNMMRLLDPGGHLVLTCPFSDHQYVENVYSLPDSDAYGRSIPFPCQSFSRSELEAWLCDTHAVIAEQQAWRLWTGDFWTTGGRLERPIRVTENDAHQLRCLLLRKHVG